MIPAFFVDIDDAAPYHKTEKMILPPCGTTGIEGERLFMEKDVMQRIASTRASMSKGQKRIADYIVTNYAVSYTHLDVYKRQRWRRIASCFGSDAGREPTSVLYVRMWDRR